MSGGGTPPTRKTLLAGIKLPHRSGAPKLILRKMPQIAEVEEIACTPSGQWSKRYEALCDAASLAIFGITEADTRPREPHPDSFDTPGPLSRYYFDDKAFASYAAALDGWYDWQHVIGSYEAEVKRVGIISYWGQRAIDVTDGGGLELRCLDRFERQLYVARNGLLPGAKISTDGTGKRAPQSVEDWGAALAAEAARFKRST